MTQDQTQVQALVKTMTDAFMAKNITAVMQSYEPGAVVAFEPGKPISDPEAMAAMFTAMSGVNPVFDYAGHEVMVSGDTALHIAPWQMTGTGPDGTEIQQSGLSVAVLRRQADGAWLMVIDNPHGSRLIHVAAD
ncbi:MAG: SgcJ/EcaC family oxidoreductase [Rhodobacteraceae bacterium]|nr:SgcJ/EcaC family oxidoreductase [Paracoccaceae bacterium]